MSNKKNKAKNFERYKYNTEDRVAPAQPEESADEFEEDSMVKQKNFAYWEVGGHTYRLKLKTKSIETLENKYRTNLINLMGSESGMPPLKTMLEIVHEAMKDWHHGINYEKVLALFDKYVDEGGSQLSFYTNVFIGIYIASGFFSKTMAEEMMSSMKEAQKMI